MTLSLQKHINLLRSGYSYLSGSLTGNPRVSGMPVTIGIELTSFCNLRCPECPSGSGTLNRRKGFMEPELFKKIISELDPFLFNVNLYFQGESMLHPEFFFFLENITHVHTVLSTNGHFLSAGNSEKLVRSGLNKLIVSIDGMDQEIYSAYRVNGKLDDVKDGIKNVTNARKKFTSRLKLEIQFLVNRLNEHQIPEVRKFAITENASLKLKSMQVINKENVGYWLPRNSKYARYKDDSGKYELKNSLPNRCLRLWFNPVVTWDGKVVPCCFDKDASHIMGDLNLQSFREIWYGPAFRLFRKDLLTNRKEIEICRNCTSGLRGIKC